MTPGTIAAAEPNQGVSGTRVLIYGRYLRGHGTAVATVSLAGVAANIEQETNSFVRVTAGAGADGTEGDIVLTANTGAVVLLSDGFTYVEGGSITAVEPSSGISGTVVTITGSNLLSGGDSVTQVSLAGTVANIVSSGNTQIVVEAGVTQSSGVEGDVVININTGAVVTDQSAFTYLRYGEIIDVSPAVGHDATTVVITGESLLGGGSLVSVTLAGVTAAVQGTPSDESIEVVAAAQSSALIGNIDILSSVGTTVTRLNGWRYVDQAAISSVLPASGAYGTVVVIRGENLLMGASSLATVSLAGTAVHEVRQATDTLIEVVAASSVASTGAITIIADSDATLVDGAFEYVTPGQVDDVSPASGNRGTEVTITGTGLLSGGSNVVAVTLDDIDANIQSQSDDTVVVIAAASASASTGHVVLTADTGAVITHEGAWEYLARGSISEIGRAHV